MVKKYVILNSDKTVNGFYSDDIHADIPSDAIEISHELHQRYFTFNAHKKVLDDGQWREGLSQAEIDEATGNTLPALKERKIAELNDTCNLTILGRFKATINETEYEFSYDFEAQSRFNGIGVMFFANKISEIEWTAYQNNQRVRIVLNQDNFDIVTLAALHHQNYNITKFNQLLLQVNSATTKEQIEAITWDE